MTASDTQGDAPEGEQQSGTAIVRELVIANKKGLHARASAKFVQTVERFDSEVLVTRGSESVGGTSIMGLMMLSAATGSHITVSATGPDAAAVMQALTDLVNGRFGEED